MKKQWTIFLAYDTVLYQDTIMNWYIDALKKYAVFSGRACRKEYWVFVFLNFIIGLILSLLTLVPVAGNIFGIISL
jgi:uncharacterized membrane protein YhaH (DUF805 family)